MNVIPFEQKHTIELLGTAMIPPYGPAWTAVDEQGVVACGGVNIDDSEGEAWIVIREGRVPAAQLHAAVLSKIDEVAREHDLLRLTASARRDWPLANDWLERLGFARTEADEMNQYYERM